MIKKILCLFVGVLSFSGLFAQKFNITSSGTTGNLSGTVIEVDIQNDETISFDLNVQNISGGTMMSVAARKVLSPQSGWTDEVCYGMGCYVPSSNNWVMSSNDAVELANNSSAIASLKIHPSAPANSLYRYYFGTTQNPYMDSMDVKVNNVLAVKEIKKSTAISVAPNPANDVLQIKAPTMENGTLKVVDVLGNVILVEAFYGSKTLNTSSFKNGVYFVMISSEGNATINRKVVIRH